MPDAGKRIMVVDDSSVMRKVLKDLFADDTKVSIEATATNGEDALSKLTSVKPDLILLDIEMPKMNGIEFLRHARLKSKAKIVVLSSVTGLGSEKAAKALKLGAKAVVSKPSGAVSIDLKEKCGSQLKDTVYKVLSIDSSN